MVVCEGSAGKVCGAGACGESPCDGSGTRGNGVGCGDLDLLDEKNVLRLGGK